MLQADIQRTAGTHQCCITSKTFYRHSEMWLRCRTCDTLTVDLKVFGSCMRSLSSTTYETLVWFDVTVQNFQCVVKPKRNEMKLLLNKSGARFSQIRTWSPRIGTSLTERRVPVRFYIIGDLTKAIEKSVVNGFQKGKGLPGRSKHIALRGMGLIHCDRRDADSC